MVLETKSVIDLYVTKSESVDDFSSSLSDMKNTLLKDVVSTVLIEMFSINNILSCIHFKTFLIKCKLKL